MRFVSAYIYVQVHTGVHAHCSEKFNQQVGVEVSDKSRFDIVRVYEEGTPPKIEGNLSLGFVHRKDEKAVSAYALALAKCFVQSRAKSKTDILDSVMVIDVGVANAFDLEVDKRMAREKREHVVEEPYASLDLALAGSV